MKSISIVALAGALIFLLVGCRKDPLRNLTDEESRIYITQRDGTANFSSLNTFSIADSVAYINNNQVITRFTAIDRDFIEAIKAQMQNRGYMLVQRNQNPDIGITVSRVYTTYQGIVDYSNRYYDYWDPFYWGYGGSSYFFPPSYGVYQVTEGALSIDMLNLKEARSTNQIRAMWNGFIRGSGIFSSQNVNSQVEALFSQSPYIGSNP